LISGAPVRWLTFVAPAGIKGQLAGMIDRVGVELPDMDAVREEVRRRAHLLLGEGYRRGEDRRHRIIDVRDESGALVLSLTLEEAILD
jgi:hypothetical protein